MLIAAPPQSIKALAIRMLHCTQGAHNAWPTGGPWFWPSFTVTHKNMEYADIKNMEYTQSVCFYMLLINFRDSHPPKSKTLVSAMTLVPRPRVRNPSSFIARSQKGYGRIQVMEGWYWLWFTLWALKTVLSGIQ